MTRTRWKLAAGALTLSLGGLAAVADGPTGCQTVPHAAIPVATPLPLPAVKVGLEPPVAVAPPTPAEVPQATPPAVPTPIALPPINPAPAVPAPAVPVPALELPLVPAATPTPQPVVRASGPEMAPMPRSAAPVFQTAAVTPTPPPAATPALSLPVATATHPGEPQAVPAPVQAQPTPAPVAEKKLRVVLHMSDDRPRFIVQDGEETYLRVVCDGVEVKSPSDRGEMMSVLKAIGKVAFVTPGGDGTCDELTVVPGTGQVVVSGKVSFKYNWGKLETTVTGERMTFRLGGGATAPVMSTSYRK